jgi:hypothetical protein
LSPKCRYIIGNATFAALAIWRVVTDAKPRSANKRDATAKILARVFADRSAGVGRLGMRGAISARRASPEGVPERVLGRIAPLLLFFMDI